MRYLEVSDFTNKANIAGIMSDIATFKIPKGMVYSFSTRMNMSLYFVERTATTQTATTTLISAHAQCADLGAAALAAADMKGQIVASETGDGEITGWTIALATGIITWGETPDGVGNIFACSTLNLQPVVATDASYPGVCEIRAEAPAGQNIGIPIFSGDVKEIQENVQNYGGTPLRLDGAVLLPEGFVLAIKINAPSTVIAGTELWHDASTPLGIKDYPEFDARRQRIPYERFRLSDFPRDFKARVLASMSVS